jgi:hypothetical protein
VKAGLCPALASTGPVCPGIALLLAHCLAARPLPSAYGLGDGAKPPENRQDLPIDALHQLWQDGAGIVPSEMPLLHQIVSNVTMNSGPMMLSASARWIKIGDNG